MKKETIHKGPDHRTSVLRHIQTPIAWAIPGLLKTADLLGFFPNTKISEARKKHKPLTADDITLSQLQMTKDICVTIKNKKHFFNFSWEYLLTSLLNGADGPVARHVGSDPNVGGIKDASVDRLSEIMIVNLIAEEIGLSIDKIHRLQLSFQLSTLTKAACEICGAKTTENGLGGMIQRRMRLRLILKDLMKLKQTPKNHEPDRNELSEKMNNELDKLINESEERAKERINAIELVKQLYNRNLFERNNIVDESSEFGEAVKYAGIITLNQEMGIDIIGELNKLVKGEPIFPSIEYLTERHPKINNFLDEAKSFLKEALTIAGYNEDSKN